MEHITTALQFKKWAQNRKSIRLVDEKYGFKVGEIVTFTNEYGIKFNDLTIIGIDDDDSFYGRCIYLNSDAYWFPHKVSELTKQ